MKAWKRSTLALVSLVTVLSSLYVSSCAAQPALNCQTIDYLPKTTNEEPADLCIPNAHNDVAIVLVHGGGGVQGSRKDMNAWAERLGKEGYITLSIDYLLFQPGQTREPIYPKPERQVKASIQYLRRNASSLGINPNHIVLLGTSAGARLAGLVFVTPDNSFFSGPEKWPQVSDRANGFIGFYGSYTGALYRNAEQYYGGSRNSSDPSIRQRLATSSAIDQAANAPGPALLLHGDADRTSPPQQSRRFYEALKSAGKDATLIIMPGANHSFDRTRERVRRLTPQGEQAARSAINWLKQHFD